MKTIPKHFRKYNSDFLQLKRDGSVAMYERTDAHGSKSWEVIRIGWNKTSVIDGRSIEEGESYPSNKTWGSRGWTFTNKKTAEEKYNSLDLSPQRR